MTEETTETTADAGSELRSRMLAKLAVAGVLVALLLGVLAVFDYLSAPEESDSRVFSEPVPVAPKKEVSKPVMPLEETPPPLAAAPEKTELPGEAPPPSDKTPLAEEKPAAADSRPARPRAAPATPAPSPAPSPASNRAPAISAPTPNAVPAQRPQPVPPAPAPAPAAPRPAAPAAAASAPPSRPAAAEVRTPTLVLPPAVNRLFSGFVLQAGVFNSAQRAEELHAKLALSGLPSSLETRVQVGPFRSRQEAEAAQAKLRELGIETILVPPRSAQR